MVPWTWRHQEKGRRELRIYYGRRQDAWFGFQSRRELCCNRRFAAGGDSLGPNKLTVWDVAENRALWTINFPPNRSLDQVAWSPDSLRLAYVSEEGQLQVWDRSSVRVVETWTAPGMWRWEIFSSLCWREKLIAAENLGGAIRLWHEP